MLWFIMLLAVDLQALRIVGVVQPQDKQALRRKHFAPRQQNFSFAASHVCVCVCCQTLSVQAVQTFHSFSLSLSMLQRLSVALQAHMRRIRNVYALCVYAI